MSASLIARSRSSAFQTNRRCGVGVARGLVLVSGLCAKAPPSWDSKMRWTRPCVGPARRARAGVADAPRPQARKNRRQPASWTVRRNRARSFQQDRRVRRWNTHSPWACRYSTNSFGIAGRYVGRSDGDAARTAVGTFLAQTGVAHPDTRKLRKGVRKHSTSLPRQGVDVETGLAQRFAS